jgi:hypothetical protein
MKGLKSINLLGTKTTKEGVAELRKKMPGCKVGG